MDEEKKQGEQLEGSSDIEAIPHATPQDSKPKSKPSKRWRALILLAFMVGLPLLTFGLITYFAYSASMRNMGTSRVQLEILPRTRTTIFEGHPEMIRAEVPFDIDTELGWLRSENILMKVVRETDLRATRNLPSGSAALDWLKRSLEIRHLGGPIFEIGVLVEGDPLLAVELANMVSTAYKQTREQIEFEEGARLLEELSLELKGQEKLMEESRVRMLESLDEAGVVDLSPWDLPAIETPLMRIARQSPAELSDEQLAELKNQSRMLVEAIFAKSHYISHRQFFDSLISTVQHLSVAAKMPRKSIHVLKGANFDPDSIVVAASPSPSYPKWLKWGLLGSVLGAAIICTLLLLRWELKAIIAAKH